MNPPDFIFGLRSQNTSYYGDVSLHEESTSSFFIRAMWEHIYTKYSIRISPLTQFDTLL